MSIKIKYLKAGYYNCNYPVGSVVEVDDGYARYVIGLGEAELALPSDKVTDPIPYVMKQRTSPAEDALVTIAQAVTRSIPGAQAAGKT